MVFQQSSGTSGSGRQSLGNHPKNIYTLYVALSLTILYPMNDVASSHTTSCPLHDVALFLTALVDRVVAQGLRRSSYWDFPCSCSMLCEPASSCSLRMIQDTKDAESTEHRLLQSLI
jgi:hypothetical protein